jgi:hypothetical protein
VAIARIRRIGEQNFVIAINDERTGEQERRRATRRHDDALGRDVYVVEPLVVSRNCFAQRTNAECTRV